MKGMNTVEEICLINIGDEFNDAEHLGIASLVAYLKKNHIQASQVLLYRHQPMEEMIDKIPKTARVIGFASFSTTFSIIVQLAQYIKQKRKDEKIFIFLGGHFATNNYKEILNDYSIIDFIIMGYGEKPLLKIARCNNIEDQLHLIPSVASRLKINEWEKEIDIKSLPHPDRSYLSNDFHIPYIVRLNSSRGCMRNCSFCYTPTYARPSYSRWQGREVDDVFDEIISIYQNYGIQFFSFTDASFEDPNFKISELRINNLADRLINYPTKLGFWCHIRAESFNDDNVYLLKKMRKAGFVRCFVGIEASNSSDLKLYNKAASIEDNNRIVRLLRECDIDLEIGFIMLNPFSTPEKLEKNFDFLKNNDIDELFCYITQLEIWPKTALHYKIKDSGLLDENFSYLSSMSYTFQDKNVEEIAYYFKQVILPSDLFKRSTDYLLFKKLFSLLKSIYNEQIIQYLEQFYTYSNRVAQCISNYFSIIYYEKDLGKAKIEFNNFENKLCKIYNEIEVFRFKILSKKPFRDYILKNY